MNATHIWSIYIYRYDENTHFYGVFDGHVGTKAADFTAQRMPAEILLGQLKGKENHQDVREVLNQAFLAVEKSFFESIDDLLAEKENLRLQLQVSIYLFKNNNINILMYFYCVH